MKKSQKVATKFYCKNCNYNTSKKSDYDKHILTLKHKNRTKSEILEQNATFHKYKCIKCNKIYNARNSLWYHSKNCVSSDTENFVKELLTNDTDELLHYLMKENAEFKQLMLEQNKQMLEIAKISGNYNNNTTNNNNQFNLNFFLNETCKNALNIMDFVSQLQIGIEDLEETARLGFAGGISKIFINGLKDIDLPHRPVHCSDPKRETLYIKNDGQWNKDDEDKNLLINAIKHVANKNMMQIPEWKKKHPGHNEANSKYNDKYLKIICESISGSTQEETNKNYNKIIRNIVKETVIDK